MPDEHAVPARPVLIEKQDRLAGRAGAGAEPRLIALSGRQASFLDGGEQAIPVPAGLGQVGVQFEEFGTRLNFVPIVLGSEARALAAADDLRARGFFVPAIRPPTVPAGSSRLRVTLSAVHEPADINDFAAALAESLA